MSPFPKESNPSFKTVLSVEISHDLTVRLPCCHSHPSLSGTQHHCNLVFPAAHTDYIPPTESFCHNSHSNPSLLSTGLWC